MSSGVSQAWERLADCDPQDVCARAQAQHDQGGYLLTVLGGQVRVGPKDRSIAARQQRLQAHLQRFGELSQLALLHYLLGALDAPLSGELARPRALRGGLIYERGSHVLPLGAIAQAYDGRAEALHAAAAAWGGEACELGDVAVRLWFFPRVPITVALWHGDEEFGPRADLLTDRRCDLQLPPDVLWSVTLISATALLLR